MRSKLNTLTLSFLLIVFLVNVMHAQKKETIAVAPFEVPRDLRYRYDFNGTGLLEKIPSLLEAELYNTNEFTMVERARLDILLDEQNLSYAGLTEGSVDYGKLKGVDYFVMGEISGFSSDYDNIRVNVGLRNMYVHNQEINITLTVKMVDVESGRLVTVITEEASIDKKGRPRANRKNGVDRKYIDECAREAVKKVALRMQEEMEAR